MRAGQKFGVRDGRIFFYDSDAFVAETHKRLREAIVEYMDQVGLRDSNDLGDFAFSSSDDMKFGVLRFTARGQPFSLRIDLPELREAC